MVTGQLQVRKKSEQMMGMKGWRLGQSLQKFQFGRVPLLDGLGA